MMIQTACHECRTMQHVATVDRDGVPRAYLAPDDGDGTVTRVFGTAAGFTAVVRGPCGLCDGSGWLAGFVIPC
jgi:hypothetical protein